MLLIRNVLVGGGLTEATSQANQNIGRKTSSSNLYTRASEAYYMALNYTALESNRCMRPECGERTMLRALWAERCSARPWGCRLTCERTVVSRKLDGYGQDISTTRLATLTATYTMSRS